MSSNDSTGKTLLVAGALCIVCSILVSFAAVALKPEQIENKQADKSRSTLAAAGLMKPGKELDELIKRVDVKNVDRQTGEFLTAENAQSRQEKANGATPIDCGQRNAAKPPGQSEDLDAAVDT